MSQVSHKASGLARWPGPIAVVSIAQLLGTSMWFSANGAGQSLMQEWHVSASDIGWLTSAVQVGFIVGTLLISLTGIVDRFRASSIFVFSAILGAIVNGCFAGLATGMVDAMLYRFIVGLCLAGIYPVGMKLLVTWVPDRPGWALSLLVAMLTLGSGLPHAFRWGGAGWNWHWVAGISSLLALGGAALIGLLGDGPYGKTTAGAAVGFSAGLEKISNAFKSSEYRSAALGYFGHMWELYAFWTVLPLIVSKTILANQPVQSTVSLVSFIVFAAGTLGCMIGGIVSKRIGSARVAAIALAMSGLSGAIYLAGWRYLPSSALLSILVIWGATAVADSPHFSALSAKACRPEDVGTALAIQNSIGFAITIVSISAVTTLIDRLGADAAWILVVGPIVGLIGLRPLLKSN